MKKIVRLYSSIQRSSFSVHRFLHTSFPAHQRLPPLIGQKQRGRPGEEEQPVPRKKRGRTEHALEEWYVNNQHKKSKFGSDSHPHQAIAEQANTKDRSLLRALSKEIADLCRYHRGQCHCGSCMVERPTRWQI